MDSALEPPCFAFDIYEPPFPQFMETLFTLEREQPHSVAMVCIFTVQVSWLPQQNSK